MVANMSAMVVLIASFGSLGCDSQNPNEPVLEMELTVELAREAIGKLILENKAAHPFDFYYSVIKGEIQRTDNEAEVVIDGWTCDFSKKTFRSGIVFDLKKKEISTVHGRFVVERGAWHAQIKTIERVGAEPIGGGYREGEKGSG